MADMTWWGADSRVRRRVLADQLYAELARLRLGAPGGPPPWLWTGDTPIGGDSAAIDSLDLLSLGAATAELLPDAVLRAPASQRFGDWCAAASPAEPARLTQITFRSSGSTGAPKRTTHPLERLDREAASFAALIGDRRRVLCAIPSHHAYGFIHSVLLPRHFPGLPAASEVVELRGCTVSEVASLLRAGDLVLGHPMFWAAVLRAIAGQLPPGIVGVTSSAPCPDETALGLRAAGLARLLQVYGSAETAGIGWRDDPASSYSLLPGWHHDAGGLRRDGRPVPTPDRLAWDGIQFRVLGRHDRMVQVSGVNVSLDEVARILGRHPTVSAIAVRTMRPDEGDRLKAFVVPAESTVDVGALQEKLRRFAVAHLSPAQCPGVYTFGTALPRSGMGKQADWICPELEVD